MKKILFINILILMFISSVFLISCTEKQNVKNSFSETESINIASKYLKQNNDFKSYFGKNIKLVSSEKLSCDSCFKIILSYERLSSKEAGAIDKTEVEMVVKKGEVEDFKVNNNVRISYPETIANPASVYCEKQSGTIEIRDSGKGGEYGICLKNGYECEEWAFFRGECSFDDNRTYCKHDSHENGTENKFCPDVAIPVCGYKDSEKKTYDNKCVACNQGADYWIEGDCALIKE